jgi:hypothetical protein
MSPEQVQGQAVDGRSDQFSLAVIAYEMLTGEKPYTGEHLTTVVYKIVTEEPPAPHRLNPSLSGPIDTVIRKALSKKPDARYGGCQEFVDALEKACASTKGWRAMPRGGSLNEPTVADTAAMSAVELPRGVKPSRLGDTTVTSARGPARKSGFLKFLLAAVAAGALIALLALQAPSWLSPPAKPKRVEESKSVKPPEAVQPPPQETPKLAPAQTAEAAPADTKPSAQAPPVAPEPTDPSAERQRRGARHAAVQPIIIITSPGGAKAMMDNRPDAVCTTPCSVDAAPGRHLIAVSLDGYEAERREVDVGTSPVELPAIILRAPGGTLMLTSIPSGASVLVDGKPTGKTTPTQLTLAPGSYKITVEHEGRQATQTVQLGAGISYLKVTL